MSSTPPDWRRSLVGAAMVFGSASSALTSLGCVPERDRQAPHVGLECHDADRCGESLVCYETQCHTPCDLPWHCVAPRECLDEVCQ